MNSKFYIENSKFFTMFIFQRHFEHVCEYINIVLDNNLMKYKADFFPGNITKPVSNKYSVWTMRLDTGLKRYIAGFLPSRSL